MLISILACSLGFHAITFECSTYENHHLKNQASVVLNPLVSLFGRLVARSGRKHGNRQTDRQTDKRNDRPSTVTLAAHARRGLTRKLSMQGAVTSTKREGTSK